MSAPTEQQVAGRTSDTVNTAKTKKIHGKTANLSVIRLNFSSRGYRPAPLFERTPPSAVTGRRHPGMVASDNGKCLDGCDLLNQ